MNRYVRWGFALAVLPLAACADTTPKPATAAPAGPPPLASSDTTFITDAAQGGMAEIQAAQLAQTTSHNPKIKSFAARMISDHTQADDQLKQIATAKGATMPTAPNDMETQQFTALQALKGRAFDKQYIQDQIADHQQMLQEFQTEAQSSPDTDLKTFAANTVPIVQSHLDAANALAKPVAHKYMHHHHHTAS